MNKKGQEGTVLIVLAIIVICAAVFLLMWGMPKYRIYKLELNGKANLKEAEWEKQIAIEEARAEKESASLKAEAEIIRARGIAEANEIISGSITTEYIKYKFVEGLNDGNTEVIYVATEAGLPILEANRFAMIEARNQ